MTGSSPRCLEHIFTIVTDMLSNRLLEAVHAVLQCLNLAHRNGHSSAGAGHMQTAHAPNP